MIRRIFLLFRIAGTLSILYGTVMWVSGLSGWRTGVPLIALGATLVLVATQAPND